MLATSLFKLAQKLLLIYRLLPFSTTNRPKRFSRPSTLLSIITLRFCFGADSPLLSNGHLSPFCLSFSRSAASCSCSSTWALRLDTTPSNRLSLSSSSASGGFLLFLGARPGPGKTHSILARTQLEHGFFLSHLTLRRRQVTHERGFGVGAPAGEDGPAVPLGLEVLSVGLVASSDIVRPCQQSILMQFKRTLSVQIKSGREPKFETEPILASSRR